MWWGSTATLVVAQTIASWSGRISSMVVPELEVRGPGKISLYIFL